MIADRRDKMLEQVRSDHIRRAMGAIHRRQLITGVRYAGLYFLCLVPSHLLVLEGQVAILMATLAGMGALVCLFCLAGLRWWRLPSFRYAWFLVPPGVAMLINIHIHVWATGEQVQLVNGLLALMVFGFLSLSTPVFLVMTAINAVFYVTTLTGVPGPYYGPYMFFLVTGTALASLAFFQRTRTLSRAVGMTLLNRRRVRQMTRLNAAIARKAEEAERANRSKTDFLANTTHELRTPLTGVIGMLKLLDKTGLSPEQCNYVSVAHSTANSLLRLINDILDAARLGAGDLDLSVRSFDPHALITTVVQLLTPNAREKGLALRLEGVPPVGLALRGDPTRIGQLLYNLIGNAIKFTATGEVVVNARLKGAVPDGSDRVTLEISIKDTGPGIAPDEQARLFERFERGARGVKEDAGGTGLGLAITRDLVALMEGRLSLESQPGQGSRFTIALPLCPADEIETTDVIRLAEPQVASPPSLSDGVEAGAPPGLQTVDHTGIAALTSVPTGLPGGEAAFCQCAGSCLNILVAEDNPVNRMLISKLLTRDGWCIEIVENGAQAVEAVEAASGAIDLVLMDIRMPVMGGLEALAAIQDLEGPAGKTPVIALTANAAPEDADLYRRAGMVDVVEKPIDLTVLEAAITAIGLKASA